MPNKTKISVKVLIMCGGKGTRMWPISNLGHPKQFEGLLGKKSMFRETIERVLKGFSAKDVYISTSNKFAKYLTKQAKEIPSQNFILEPAMRDNLGAVGLASAVINKRHPDSVMVILWGADHLVQKEKEFIKAIKEAVKVAFTDKVIVHVDTPPQYPSVHNGWIEIGKKIKNSGGYSVYEFIHQVEKPDEKTAIKLFKSKKYLIHVGYMATRPSLLLDYYQKYAPKAYKILKALMPSIDTADFKSQLAKLYPKFEKISIDYGLFEKLPPRTQYELPVNMGWIDVGTWGLLYNGLPKDKDGNVVMGKAHLIDVKNSLILGRDKGVVGVIGLDSVIVVATPDGILTCPLNRASSVKQLYNELYKQ